jgi:hypothetical protein
MKINEHQSDIEWLIDAVEYVEGYKLALTFRDGSRRLVDLATEVLSGKVYEPLRDIEYFKTVFTDGTSISWTNGADFAPEYLYEKGEVITQVPPRDERQQGS